MRGFFTLLLCLYSIIASATDYYVSSTGNDSANGLSSSTPWKTISKVNAEFSRLLPGDRVLFNKGDTFYGTLTISRSGSSSSPITLGAYGSGSNPVISAFTVISGWTDEGNGIFSKTISAESSPNVVTLDGVVVPMGRYPDKDWLSIDSYSGNTSITDAALPSYPDWDGGEVVIRKNHWVTDRNLISSHSGTTINYNSASGYSAIKGFGYFVQNHLSTLTSPGEWYYRGGKFYMYFGSAGPSGKVVKVSSLDENVNIKLRDYVTITNITMEGANKSSVFISSSSYIAIQNCNIFFCADRAINGGVNSGKTSQGFRLMSNNINDILNVAIILANEFSGALISGNTINNISMIPGLAGSGDGQSIAVSLYGSNHIVEYNRLTNLGFNAIDFSGNNIKIRYNFINNWALMKDDSGGIYTSSLGSNYWTGTEIVGNIILNGLGAPNGVVVTDERVQGIYCDHHNRDILIQGNTVYNCGMGIYIKNAHEIKIHDNVLFANRENQLHGNHTSDYPDSPLRNIDIRGNIMVSKAADIKIIDFNTYVNEDDLRRFGTADYNYYARPINDANASNRTLRTTVNWYGVSSNDGYRSVTEWSSWTGQDANSSKSKAFISDVSKFRFEYNASTSNKVVSLDGSYVDVKGAKYNGSITLAPYTSAVLMVDPNPSAPPAVPVYSSAAVQDGAPSIVEMTYSLALANIVPAASAFTVQVNSTARTVSSVSVSGTKVLLTLSSPVAYGNTGTVAYTKPSANPLQTSAGGQAATISAQSVTNRVAAPAAPAVPAYVSSEIKDAARSVVEMTYNLSLANIVPAASAFTVQVNSTARSVSSVSVSGTKVLLTLSSPVAYGNTVTVAYTKPSTSPLQTSAGGQAATISAQSVTNRIAAPPAPAVPVYVSSVIENAAPSVIEITYNLALASKVPAGSAFTVQVNSTARSVSSVSVSGTKVLLTLSSPVAYGNTVTVAYTKPSTNPIQTAAGGQASTISAQSVTNRVSQPAPPPVVVIPPPVVPNTQPVPVIKFQEKTYSGFIGEIDARGSYDTDKDKLSFSWKVPAEIPVSATNTEVIQFLAPLTETSQTYEFILIVSDGKATQSKTIPITVVPYEPDLEIAEVISVKASDSYSNNLPYNIIDGNIGTMWSSKGEEQSLILELKSPFIIQHIKIAFQPGQKMECYFDIYGSNDGENWESILVKAKSCSFSGGIHVFEFPISKAITEYRYLKFVGLGNSVDSWNYISEFRIFGYRHKNRADYEDLIVKLYPNPAREIVNIKIDDAEFNPDFIKILTLDGKVMYSNIVDPMVRDFQVPVNFTHGIYIVQMGMGNITMFTQKLIVFR
jgi:uncharacterized repeat protein (TIGR02059 family)